MSTRAPIVLPTHRQLLDERLPNTPHLEDGGAPFRGSCRGRKFNCRFIGSHDELNDRSGRNAERLQFRRPVLQLGETRKNHLVNFLLQQLPAPGLLVDWQPPARRGCRAHVA